MCLANLPDLPENGTATIVHGGSEFGPDCSDRSRNLLSDCPGLEIYEEANFNPDVSAFRIEVTNTRPSLMREFFGYVQFSTVPDSLTTVRQGNDQFLRCQLMLQFFRTI